MKLQSACLSLPRSCASEPDFLVVHKDPVFPLSSCHSALCVMTDGGRPFFLRSNHGGKKTAYADGVNRERPLAFLTSLTVCAMQSEAGGVGGLLTFGWLAISRGQERRPGCPKVRGRRRGDQSSPQRSEFLQWATHRQGDIPE